MANNEAMPVVYDGKAYGYGDTIIVEEFYVSDYSDSAYFFDAEAPEEEIPWEVAVSGSHNLIMSKAQARALRNQLSFFLDQD